MLAYAVACVVSILVRWPLIGVAWHLVTGEGTAWRRNRAVLRAYDLATRMLGGRLRCAVSDAVGPLRQ